MRNFIKVKNLLALAVPRPHPSASSGQALSKTAKGGASSAMIAPAKMGRDAVGGEGILALAGREGPAPH